MNRKSRRAAGSHRKQRAAAPFVVAPLAVLMFGAGAAFAVPTQQQPGVTDQQPGLSSPAPVLPPKPQSQSPLGAALPDPPQHHPSEYQAPPSVGGGQATPAPYYDSPAVPSPAPYYEGPAAPAPAPQTYYYVEPTPQYSAPTPSLGEELLTLHAPAPVPQKPKYWVPVAPEYLGVGQAKIVRPEWVPIDVAWKANAHLSEAQHGTNTALQSVGINASRAEILAGGTVAGAAAGACIGAVVIGVPAAVFGAVAGGLIGGTVGGLAGAAMGTLIPVPVVGTVTSGIAGTAIGAAAGAAAGAAIIGIPAAVAGGAAGGALGGLIGFALTAGDGSDYTGPAPDGEIPMEEREVPEPGPTLTEQFAAQAETAIDAGEEAVEWVEAQPGGEQILDQAVEVVDQVDQWAHNEPVVSQAAAVIDQTVNDAVTAAQAAPETAEVATAAVEALTEQAPFAPGTFGPLTDAANGMLAGAQAAVR